jgi:hypothetical protein
MFLCCCSPRPLHHSDTDQLTEMARIGHAFRRQAAGAFGPDLAKKLSQLVKMEKNVMRSMELVGRERMEVAVWTSLNFPRERRSVTDRAGSSNNCPSGARHVTRMSRMSPIS